jgi:hypothetical protein
MHTTPSYLSCPVLSYPPVTLFHFDPNILLSTLFPKVLTLCSSLNVRDQVPTHTEPQANCPVYSNLYVLDCLRKDEVRS